MAFSGSAGVFVLRRSRLARHSLLLKLVGVQDIAHTEHVELAILGLFAGARAQWNFTGAQMRLWKISAWARDHCQILSEEAALELGPLRVLDGLVTVLVAEKPHILRVERLERNLTLHRLGSGRL